MSGKSRLVKYYNLARNMFPIKKQVEILKSSTFGMLISFLVARLLLKGGSFTCFLGSC